MVWKARIAYLQMGLSFLLCGILPAHLSASPVGTTIFCQKYAGAPACNDEAASCNVCHAGPPGLNPYGDSIVQNLNGDLASGLYETLDKIDELDSDGDGVNNREEILFGGHPGNRAIAPIRDVQIEYDREMAFKRVMVNYCGRPASYQELQNLNAAADQKAFMHEQLDQCLDSDYWKNEALHRLADRKIQPLSTIGFGGNVVIGDYRYDYWLFSYIMSGDRDVRELLSAQYHIDANGNKIEGTIAREEAPQIGERIVIAGGQPLAPQRRAGMMTTQWFFANFTMFSQLPRNTASQVYREYLGLDIAKGEGLMPVPNEPRDVDNINIAQAECAVCHSTLDPLAYAFSTYVGIETVQAFLFNTNGTYRAGRAPWEADGVLFGQPVGDLLEWAEIARNSDQFKKNIAHMLFTQALSREPMPHETEEYDALWQGLPADGFSANRLIHRFVETNAFAGRIVK
ncbi:MAG: hypothetical protein ACOH5I_07885 [Oligoflexus sp.]